MFLSVASRITMPSPAYRATLLYFYSAQVQSGNFVFKPSMFPIVSMLNGNFSLGLNSSTCSFV
jgi:hypothetical protein